MISGDLRIDTIKTDAEKCTGSYATMVDLCEEIERLSDVLGEIYRETGADPDGDENWRLAPYALDEVKRLRREHDELLDEVPLT